jgi:hypothetical protein
MTNTASTRHRGHPITVAAREMHSAFDELVDQSTWSMTDAETRATLRELTRAEARLAELKLRVAAHGEKNKVGDDTGASSTANWWAHQTNATRAATHRDVKLAKALDTGAHEPVRRALAAGEVLVDQAAVIVRAVDALPEDAEAWVAPKAQEWLLDQAAHHDAKTLRILGRRILEVVDPAAADAHEARLLEKEEQAAEAAAMFRMHDDGHGKCHGKFTISSRHGAILKKALLAKAAPKHQAAVTGHAPEPDQPTAHKMGLAFQEYSESYPADALPKAGGVNATVVVTMTLEALLGGLKAAQLDTGEKITASEARRMACAAGVIPAVLDGKSKVLDLGRKRRFHSQAQRIVATIEQGGCTAEGCDWPPGMCHMHHPEPWSRGGGTNRDGRLLCPRHHTLIHDVRYDTTHHPNGKVSFHRRR